MRVQRQPSVLKREKTSFFYIEILLNFIRPIGSCSFWVPRDNKGHKVPKYLSLEFFEVSKTTSCAHERKTSFFYIEILLNFIRPIDTCSFGCQSRPKITSADQRQPTVLMREKPVLFLYRHYLIDYSFFMKKSTLRCFFYLPYCSLYIAIIFTDSAALILLTNTEFLKWL